MSFSRILTGSTILGMIALGPLRADTLVSVRPGVACTSADALARLTQPDGSSRSVSANATADAREIARRGGCLPFRPGITVFPHSTRRQTSIVTAYTLDRAGPLTLYVANIDFERFAVPGGRGAGVVEFRPPLVRQAPTAALSGDRPAAADAWPAGTRRRLSTGLLSLGITTRDAKRRFTSTFVVFDLAGSADGRDAAFIAETRDQSERYEVRSRAGTVFFVMHSVRFARGHQPVLSGVVDRLLAQYGTGPTLITLPGAAGTGVSLMPPQAGWQHDWIGRPVVMSPRDSLEDATGHAGRLARCAQQMVLLDPSHARDEPIGDRSLVIAAGPGLDAPSCGKEVLVRLEQSTNPKAAERLLVILSGHPALIEQDTASAEPSVR